MHEIMVVVLLLLLLIPPLSAIIIIITITDRIVETVEDIEAEIDVMQETTVDREEMIVVIPETEKVSLVNEQEMTIVEMATRTMIVIVIVIVMVETRIVVDIAADHEMFVGRGVINSRELFFDLIGLVFVPISLNG